MEKKLNYLKIGLSAIISIFVGIIVFKNLYQIDFDTLLNPLHNLPIIKNVYAADPDFKQLSDTIVESGVMSAWKVLLAMSNSLFVIFILFTGTANVLRFNIDTYSIKKILPSLILGAILANFSLLVCRLLLEASAVFSNWLLTMGSATAVGSGSGGLLEKVYEQLGIGTIESMSLWTNSGVASLGIIGIVVSWIFIGGCGAFILLVLLLFAPILFFWALILLFYIRYFVVIALTIASPIAFFSVGFPITEKYFKQWWDLYFKWTFMPCITFFVIWIGVTIADALGGGATPSQGMALMRYLILIGALYYSAKIPLSMGGGVMGAWSGLLKQGGGLASKAYGSVWSKGSGIKAKDTDRGAKAWIKNTVGKGFKNTNFYGAKDAWKMRTEDAEKARISDAKKGRIFGGLAGSKPSYMAYLKEKGEINGFVNDPKIVWDKFNKTQADLAAKGITLEDKQLTEMLTLSPAKISSKKTGIEGLDALGLEERADLVQQFNRWIQLTRSSGGKKGAADLLKEARTAAAKAAAGAGGGGGRPIPAFAAGTGSGRTFDDMANELENAISQKEESAIKKILGNDVDTDKALAGLKAGAIIVKQDGQNLTADEISKLQEIDQSRTDRMTEKTNDDVSMGADQDKVKGILGESVDASAVLDEINSGATYQDISSKYGGNRNITTTQWTELEGSAKGQRARENKYLEKFADHIYESTEKTAGIEALGVARQLKLNGTEINEETLSKVQDQMEEIGSSNRSFEIRHAELKNISPAIAEASPDEETMKRNIQHVIKGMETLKSEDIYKEFQKPEFSETSLPVIESLQKANHRSIYRQGYAAKQAESITQQHLATSNGSFEGLEEKLTGPLEKIASSIEGMGENLKNINNLKPMLQSAFKTAASQTSIKPISSAAELGSVLTSRKFKRVFSQAVKQGVNQSTPKNSPNTAPAVTINTEAAAENTGQTPTGAPHTESAPPAEQAPTPPVQEQQTPPPSEPTPPPTNGTI
ncbi:MAG: hypothetical protein WCW17_01425 [Patescibacteria group bacterium]|jgi:hypothetical protein